MEMSFVYLGSRIKIGQVLSTYLGAAAVVPKKGEGTHEQIKAIHMNGIITLIATF